MGLLSQLALMVLSASSEGADLIGPWAITGCKWDQCIDRTTNTHTCTECKWDNGFDPITDSSTGYKWDRRCDPTTDSSTGCKWEHGFDHKYRV